MNPSKQIDNVSIATKANVYFDGKCISHTIFLPDGTRKSVGVILPSRLTFDTQSAELMELVAGSCRVRQKGDAKAATYQAGNSFRVAANSSFEIEVLETLHYVCHFE